VLLNELRKGAETTITQAEQESEEEPLLALFDAAQANKHIQPEKEKPTYWRTGSNRATKSDTTKAAATY
jgi:hypothetical protein